MLDYLTLILAAAAAGLAGLGLHKARRIHLKLFDLDRLVQERVDNLYTQLTTLNRLERTLSLPGALPPTRGWAGSPDFLRHVHDLARAHRPRTVVECSSGTSTIVLARTLQMSGTAGHVHSLEHDPLYASKTRDALQEFDLSSLATVIDAPLVSHVIDGQQHRWYRLDDLPGGIDMLVIDGPPVNTQRMARYPALPLLIDRLSPGALVVLDDAARPDERAAVDQWVQRFGLVRLEGHFAEKGIAVLQRPAHPSGTPGPETT
ncbi:MAG TPA: class I SAM-dependent methyltransferase [Pseudorhodoferax sp.]|jgi:predicted O-methyltransferase YrrM|nr:class I SAM-dependent methyltransferase [Pseudorhodoferax sp.]